MLELFQVYSFQMTHLLPKEGRAPTELVAGEVQDTQFPWCCEVGGKIPGFRLRFSRLNQSKMFQQMELSNPWYPKKIIEVNDFGDFSIQNMSKP